MALQAGKLDRRLRIERKAVSRDAYLAEVVSWQEVATVWASKRDLSGREFFAADAVQSEVTTEITIRWRAGIGPELRLVLDGAAYDIESVTEIGRREGLLLRCTRGGTVPLLVELSGHLALAATLAGNLRVEKRLAGVLTGGLAMTGDLKTRGDVLLAGALHGALLLTGRLAGAGAALSGTITGTLAMAGALRVEKRLAGNLAGGISLEGTALVARHLAGGLQGGLTLAGDLTVPPSGDPSWEMVSLSMPMDGEEASTTLVDVKNSWRSFTRIGSTAALDTAVKQFGTASLSIGAQSYFRCDNAVAFDFGAGDFTVEAWYRRGAGSGNRWIAAKWGSGTKATAASWGLYEQDSKLTFVYYNQSNSFMSLNLDHTPIEGTWRHVAVTREAGTFRLYADGVKLGEMSNGDVIRSGVAPFSVGGFDGTSHLGEPCHLEDVRVTKGVARYTGESYSVPTGPHPVESPETGDLWTPLQQGDLALWLDAADDSAVSVDAGAVSAWADKSGNARHVGEVNASRRPAYQAAGWPGGLPCIDWDIAANVKRLFHDPGVAGQDYRINFVVAVWDDPAGTFPTYNALFGGYAQAGLNSGVCLAVASGGTSWFTGGAGAWHAGQTFHNGAAAADLTAMPLIQSPFIVRADSAAATNAQGVTIGNNRNYISNNYGWRGRVAEVVSVSVAISLADKQRIEGYLAHKWGIALEAGHPYESAPPII
ncbi:phage head closure protein [Oceanibaculum indicum]|uniref:Phage head-tail adaptor n=1 Tax=Oceanibaculum indicum P24 TaxID=1207063 RepID=K2JDT3_9PROT|nr:phage head closure protein [Oceanibaculum indicum]EKE68694.1 phage head-tail adaptor [Oceanibaculum indicum P24]